MVVENPQRDRRSDYWGRFSRFGLILTAGRVRIPLGARPSTTQKLQTVVVHRIRKLTSSHVFQSFFLLPPGYLNTTLSTHCAFTTNRLHLSARTSTIPQNLGNFNGSHQANNETLQQLPWNWTPFLIIVRMRKPTSLVPRLPVRPQTRDPS